MVKDLIVRTCYNPKFFSVSVCDDVLQHYLKFKDNEIILQKNLFIAIVKDDYNKEKELPSKYVFKDNKNFYDVEILDWLNAKFDKRLIITKTIQVMLNYLRFIEKKLNIVYKYDFDDKTIYKYDFKY